MPGHITELGKNYFEITIEAGRGPNGKRKRIKRRVKCSSREAKLKLSELEIQLEKGIYIEEKKLTLGQYLEQWFKHHEKSLAATTQENYRYILDAHLIPKLGSILIQKLAPLHLQNYYTEALKSGRSKGEGGLSSRSVRYHHSILHKALKQAVKWRLVNANVAEAVDPPKKEKTEIKYLEETDIGDFQDLIETHPLKNFFFVALYTGLRRSEILGLRWSDIDFENGLININQTLHRLCKKGYIFKTTKTVASQEAVVMPDLIADILKDMDQTHELVFCDADGNPLNPDTVTRKMTKIMETLKKEVTLHGLRHTYATTLLKNGANMKIVQEMLRHTQISTSFDIYTHITPDTKREAAQKINEIFSAQNGHKMGTNNENETPS